MNKTEKQFIQETGNSEPLLNEFERICFYERHIKWLENKLETLSQQVNSQTQTNLDYFESAIEYIVCEHHHLHPDDRDHSECICSASHILKRKIIEQNLSNSPKLEEDEIRIAQGIINIRREQTRHQTINAFKEMAKSSKYLSSDFGEVIRPCGGDSK